MKRQYESDIEDHMHHEKRIRNDNLAAMKNAAVERIEQILEMEISQPKLKAWEEAYEIICEHEIMLSPQLWLRILEDDIGLLFDDREERYELIVKSLPHANGHPMRVDECTFQPELYIDGKWLGLEAIADPEPKLVEQQKVAEEWDALEKKTNASLKKAEAVMSEIKTTLNDYDAAMSVVK